MSGLGRVLVTGGGGAIGSNVTDELVLAGAEEVVVLDNFVRGRRENLAWARENGNVTLVEGDIRDRTLVRRLMDGIDVVFHLAAIRITQCAEEPRLALEVLVDGTYNVFEAAAEAEVRKVIAVLIGLGLRAGGDVPHPRGPPPVRQRHHLRRVQGVQRGAAAQHARDVRPRLRGAALLQRLRPAHGRARPLHRGARPLDGADRRRPAAADPRRRPADDGLRLHRRRRARQTSLAAQSDLTDVVYNVASGSETSLLELAQALAARHGLRPPRRAWARARRQRGHAPAGGHVARARGARASRRRSGSRKGSSGSSSGGAASAPARRPSRRGCSRRRRDGDPVQQADAARRTRARRSPR